MREGQQTYHPSSHTGDLSRLTLGKVQASYQSWPPQVFYGPSQTVIDYGICVKIVDGYIERQNTLLNCIYIAMTIYI